MSTTFIHGHLYTGEVDDIIIGMTDNEEPAIFLTYTLKQQVLDESGDYLNDESVTAPIDEVQKLIQVKIDESGTPFQIMISQLNMAFGIKPPLTKVVTDGEKGIIRVSAEHKRSIRASVIGKRAAFRYTEKEGKGYFNLYTKRVAPAALSMVDIEKMFGLRD
jgi:hypothetical protein